jgi:hypothetical protein
MRVWRTFLVGAVLLLSAAASAGAAAAPPPNDNRNDATAIGPLPQTVRGTTVGASTEPREPGSSCDSAGGSVWYSLAVGGSPPPRIGLKLAANDPLDAVLDVFVRARSRSIPVSCDTTDRAGRAAIAFAPSANTTYLIRVSLQPDSDPGTFSLNAFALPPEPRPPGPLLGPRGADGLLDGTLATEAAYSMQLTAGTTYKINLVKRTEGCMALRIFPPGTGSFDAAALGGLSCAGYRLYTPRLSGRFSFLIVAARSNRGSQPYGLHVAPATSREMVPGIFLPNLSHYKGFLRGNVIDDVRLFRFDVTQRSDLTLFLLAASDAPFDLKLLNDQGRYIQCNCGSVGQETIRRQTPPGRYYAVVQAHDFGWGPFTIFRQSRLITHVNVRFDGTRYEQVPPGATTHLIANVTPAVDGPVTFQVQFFDPVERWQFYRAIHGQAVNGVASIPFLPPHVGRWRAFVSFDGTRTASPATGDVSQILVAGPLRQ